MPRPSLSVLLLSCLFVVAPFAHADDFRCDVHSDYDLTLNDRSLILIREQGTPARIVLRQGRMFIDDAWVTLTPEDSARIAEFEQDTRAMLPLAQEVGREAADIALIAVGEVAAGFSRDPAATRRQLDDIRGKLDVQLKQRFSRGRFTEVDIDEQIGGLVADLLPQFIGDVVSGAVQAALTGNAATLRSLDGIDARVEKLVEPKARRLRPKAERLCTRMQALDALDDALTYRLPDGRALELLDVRQRNKNADSE